MANAILPQVPLPSRLDDLKVDSSRIDSGVNRSIEACDHHLTRVESSQPQKILIVVFEYGGSWVVGRRRDADGSVERRTAAAAHAAVAAVAAPSSPVGWSVDVHAAPHAAAVAPAFPAGRSAGAGADEHAADVHAEASAEAHGADGSAEGHAAAAHAAAAAPASPAAAAAVAAVAASATASAQQSGAAVEKAQAVGVTRGSARESGVRQRQDESGSRSP